MTARVIDKDVIVSFISNGEKYGEDRFLIKAKPGESIEQLVHERAKESRFAIPGANYELSIQCKEMVA